ncbi:MAG: hypothetical protein HRJ53_08310 [Acidobacteria bacterium Pan2503]|uniref:Uncharacterized protein n=1 Tax=Candidatus Acidiferrum panamense TaxID=2741543 RepID=A0A7V8NP86_9BACT|nr:hypothetical protein [Candidatus Acidoferrum panamensis]
MKFHKVTIGREKKHFRSARWKGWQLVAGLYQGEECPRCLAWVRTPVRYQHEDDHEEFTEWAEDIHRAILKLARALSIDVDLEDPDGGEETRGTSVVIDGTSVLRGAVYDDD